MSSFRGTLRAENPSLSVHSHREGFLTSFGMTTNGFFGGCLGGMCSLNLEAGSTILQSQTPIAIFVSSRSISVAAPAHLVYAG